MGGGMSSFFKNIAKKMVGERRQNIRRNRNLLTEPLLRPDNIRNFNPRQQVRNAVPVRRDPAVSQFLSRKSRSNSQNRNNSGLGGPVSSPNLVRVSNRQNQTTSFVQLPQPLTPEIRHKMNVYCFKKSRNIIQIHQRHATTCANVLNKGFDASISDIKEFAPNTSLTAIGIQQCMQVSDFLLFCKSKNINYITSQNNTTIDELKSVLQKQIPKNQRKVNSNSKNQLLQLEELINKIKLLNIDEEKKNKIIKKLEGEKKHNFTKTKFLVFIAMLNTTFKMDIDQTILNKLSDIDFISSRHELIQKKELRPMLIFCCSELLRTQQTLFITYFDIIKDYLKNRRKIIVLFWLNEQHFSKSFNADNFVLSLAHTKLQWKYFIKRIKNLEFDKNLMENIGREIGHAELAEFSKKLNLEENLHTSTTFSGKKINYEEWEDIFYVSPHIYPVDNTNARLLVNFSFDNRRFTGKYGFFSKQTVKVKTLYDPKEMYRELPEILSKYILYSTIITQDSDYGVDFYEECISPEVKMNIVFVSHHNSGENALKYLTENVSKDIFSKQQLMNGELVILPKGGILGKKEYMREFGGVNDDEYKDHIDKDLDYEKNKQEINLKSIITSYLTNKNNFEYNIAIQSFENTYINLLNQLYQSQNNVSNNQEIKQKISSIERLIIYFKYLKKRSASNLYIQETLTFTLKNRIFPVGFYDMIINSTITRKNKTNQPRQIYPLFILYNSQLDIFFTPLDIVKQEVAIIPEVVFPSSPNPQQQTAGESTGIESSSQIFSLSSPLQKYLNMTLDEYISFLNKSKEIIDEIIKYYYQSNSNQQNSHFNEFKTKYLKDNPNFMPREGNANTFTKKTNDLKDLYNKSIKKNEYFYNYKKLSEFVEKSILKITKYNDEIKKSKNNANRSVINIPESNNQSNQSKQSKQFAIALIQSVYVAPTLLQYLRNNFDTKTLVHSFDSCLFDFCAISEPAKNRFRQIVREKLKLEVGEKNYTESFQKEVARRLKKFVVEYEQDNGEIKNTNKNAKIIPTYNERPYSKTEILEDSNYLNTNNTINAEVIKIYSKYFIIDDVFAESKILELIGERNRNGTANNRKTSINTEISRILQPFQKKFMDMLMHKNIRNNGELNVSTQIHREASYQSFRPLNPFCPMTVRGNRNVLDEIIAFYKTEKVGETKKRIIDQVKADYQRRMRTFNFIKDNYLKNDKIEYNSYWKIIAEDYGNLNIEYAQSAVFLIYVSLFYRYNKLEFFKNIYLVNSLFHEKFNPYSFINYILQPSKNEEINIENYLYYLYISPKFNLFAMIFDESRPEIWDNKSNLNKIKLFLYYIIEYNNDDVKIYYNRHGLIFLYFSYCIPSLIFFHYTKDNAANYKEYTNNQYIDYLLNLSDEDIKEKSKIIIDKYIIKYKEYIMSLNIDIRNISLNKNINKRIKYNKNGNSGIINEVPVEGSINAVRQSTKPFNLHKILLMEQVYFAT